MIPTLKDVMHSKFVFDHYEDGVIWYTTMWSDNGFPRKFDLPIPVDMPNLYEVMQEAAYNLENIEDHTIVETKEMLEYAVDKAKRAGASAGRFGYSEKAITLMRWIRKHIDHLNNLQAAEEDEV